MTKRRFTSSHDNHNNNFQVSWLFWEETKQNKVFVCISTKQTTKADEHTESAQVHWLISLIVCVLCVCVHPYQVERERAGHPWCRSQPLKDFRCSGAGLATYLFPSLSLVVFFFFSCFPSPCLSSTWLPVVFLFSPCAGSSHILHSNRIVTCNDDCVNHCVIIALCHVKDVNASCFFAFCLFFFFLLWRRVECGAGGRRSNSSSHVNRVISFCVDNTRTHGHTQDTQVCMKVEWMVAARREGIKRSGMRNDERRAHLHSRRRPGHHAMPCNGLLLLFFFFFSSRLRGGLVIVMDWWMRWSAYWPRNSVEPTSSPTFFPQRAAFCVTSP